jgi:hypothetical protein
LFSRSRFSGSAIQFACFLSIISILVLVPIDSFPQRRGLVPFPLRLLLSYLFIYEVREHVFLPDIASHLHFIQIFFLSFENGFNLSTNCSTHSHPAFTQCAIFFITINLRFPLFIFTGL